MCFLTFDWYCTSQWFFPSPTVSLCLDSVYASSMLRLNLSIYILYVRPSAPLGDGLRRNKLSIICSSNYLFFFSVTGELFTLAQLDREKMMEYDLVVKATDGGGRSCQADILLMIQDMNDNPPKFSNNHYEVTVFDNTTVRTPIAVIYAKDPDTGKLCYWYKMKSVNILRESLKGLCWSSYYISCAKIYRIRIRMTRMDICILRHGLRGFVWSSNYISMLESKCPLYVSEALLLYTSPGHKMETVLLFLRW